MSLWDKTKEQAAKAADATKRATKKLNHLAVIADKKRRIGNAKRRYGVAIFDAFDTADQVFADQLFLELREKVAELEQAIVDKEALILAECDPKYVISFVPTSIATHEAAKQNYGNYHKTGAGAVDALPTAATTSAAIPSSPKVETKVEAQPESLQGGTQLQHAMKPKIAGGKRTRGTAPPTQEALLQWTQTALKGFNKVNVTDFSKSWMSGLAFAALVCNYEPQAITLSAIDPAKSEATLRVAFDAAETIGVAVLLDPEDMPLADEKSIFSTVSMFYRTMSNLTPSDQGRTQWNARFP